jgi:5-formyltetrahydrofolate cyclo-ligase
MDHKSDVRNRVWHDLRKVAAPDSRFHYDFGEFIADFDGGAAACERLVAHRFYRDAMLIFIAPDNCIERLRERALADGKTVLMTTYSIRRGFWLLEPEAIGLENFRLASMLDAMERFARPVTLAEIGRLPPVEFLVTGTGAINLAGVRFGKGHGFFDVEWAMLYEMGRIGARTPAAAVVHDCQLLDQVLYPEVYDTVVDAVFTPTRTIEVDSPHKPTGGILWDRLDPQMLETIPPLQELRRMRTAPA